MKSLRFNCLCWQLAATILILGASVALYGCNDDDNDDKVCESGFIYSNIPCAENAGTQTKTCIEGKLYPTDACTASDGTVIVDTTGEDACTTDTSGATRAVSCENNGFKPQVCTDGEWKGNECFLGPDDSGFTEAPGGTGDNGGNGSDPTNVCTSFTELETYKFNDAATIDGCFDVNENIEINADVTIAAGTTLRFAEEKELFVSKNGGLSAVGTSGSLIVFKGQNELAGYWSGVRFSDSHSLNNELSYVVIDGGGYAQDNNSAGLTLARFVGYSSVKMTHTTIRNSGHYGVHGGRNATFTAFENNDLSGNPDGPMYVQAETLPSLDDASNYGDSDVDRIVVYDTKIGDGTLPATNVPYLFNDGFSVTGNSLTIAPGAQLEFEENTEAYIGDDNVLAAVGTEAKRIVFRGAKPVAGYWNGIRFRDSPSQDNELTYVTIQDGEINLTLGGFVGYSTANLNHVTFNNFKDNAVSLNAFTDKTSYVNDCTDLNITADDVGGNANMVADFITECGL